MSEFVSYRFLGIRAHALVKADLLNIIDSAIEADSVNCIIGNHNLHSLYLVHNNPAMREFYNMNSYTHIDGMGIILLARIMGIPLLRRHRNGYLDWFEDFAKLASEKSWRIYFLGGTPEVADKMPQVFRARFPSLDIRAHHGYDAFEPHTTVFEEIRDFAPHVVMVGMGMPLQERWIMESVEKLKVNVLLSCGAIMDYYVGAQKPAPRWMGQIGFEWLYRLVTRPQSLCFRYLVEPLMLMPMLLREWRERKTYADERHG